MARMKGVKEALYLILIIALLGGNGYQWWEGRKCRKMVEVQRSTVVDTVFIRQKVDFHDVQIPEPIRASDWDKSPRAAKVASISAPTIGGLWYFTPRILPAKVKGDTVRVDSSQGVPIHSLSTDTAVNIYADTLERSGVALYYEHRVRGTLLSSRYSIEHPQVTVRKTDRVDINRLAPWSLFTLKGLHVHEGFTDVTMGAGFTNKKLMVAYQFGLGQRSHHISAGVRLYGK